MKLQTCPEPNELLRLLEGFLDEQAEATIEKHLSLCAACRSEVDQQIQSDIWWWKGRNSLRTNEVDLDSEDGRRTSFDVLSLLGPTDDPEKMGRIAEYEVMGIIGRGGMGIVFKAFDPRLNRFVAIKVLLPHLAATESARKRFAREGKAAAAVVDDHVLPIYVVSEWLGVPYLVTQYSRGTTLQNRVQTEGPLELSVVLRLGMQTARGLAAAHAQGLVHRDVKPSNILLDGSVERAMLTDFGLARAVDDVSITKTGIIAGTPLYMSPEQARGQNIDARSDLFSLGSVLYFLCTGHPPFCAENSYAVLRLITDEQPCPIREINSNIPDWLCTIVQKLMSKSPNERYVSATEVADILEACLAYVQQPATVALPESLTDRSEAHVRTRKNYPGGAFLMSSALFAVVSSFIFLMDQPPMTSSSDLIRIDGETRSSSEVGWQQRPARSSAASRLVTTIAGVDQLKTELRTMINLTSPAERKQWASVNAYADSLFMGVDATRPLQVQHLPSIAEGATLYWVPLPDSSNPSKALRSNLESFGFTVEPVPIDVDDIKLYRLNSHLDLSRKMGWLRINVELNRFVSIQSSGCFYIGSWWSGYMECPGRLGSPGGRGTPGCKQTPGSPGRSEFPGRSEVPGFPRCGVVLQTGTCILF